MKRVGFIGCGKIGRTMLNEITDGSKHEISFVLDPFFKKEEGMPDFPVISEIDEELLKNTDLVIEAAMADVLKKNIRAALKYCDMMIFSVTAFADDEFRNEIMQYAKDCGHRIYLPHGAILGVDGISDGRAVIKSVTIETVKNPKSLGRDDKWRTIVYEGNTRGACEAYPRNVNVHATVALAGIGFEDTRSIIISDPDTNDNAHVIKVQGEGINFEIHVASVAGGKVTGKYTPYSAVSSMHKILDEDSTVHFI